MDNFSDKLNLDELYERKNEVEQNRIKIYQKILARAHTKIKITSRQRISEQFCFFIIPEFLVGTPRYDSAACTAYIMDKLIDNGFLIKYTHPNLYSDHRPSHPYRYLVGTQPLLHQNSNR